MFSINRIEGTEFELDERHVLLREKMDLIQSNTKFFVEVLANSKTDSAETIIIGECRSSPSLQLVIF
jgi:hypothetical protein